MSLKFRTFLALLIGAVLGVTLSVGSGVLADRDPPNESLPWEEARLLAEVLERVRQEYVEPTDDNSLMESEEIRISTTGNYSGVGLEVNMIDDEVTVVAPIEGTPADRGGLKSGDVILSIDGEPVDERNVDDTVNRMRGKPGTKVMLSVRRDGEAEPLEFKLIRSHVQVKSVRAELLEPGYGYIRVTHFSETTFKDLRHAIKNLQNDSQEELTGLILDLRNNPGGVLDAAVEVSDAFLDEGVIVTASGRGRDSNFSHEAHPGDLLRGAALVVIVNKGSASASEIVAGALQDNDRATVVGAQTFGKGSVQTVMPLSNGRAIKLTTSLYYTPSGDSIHGSGITPDIFLDEAGLEDLLAGTAQHKTEAGAALLQSDTQLRQALNVLRGGRVAQSKSD